MDKTLSSCPSNILTGSCGDAVSFLPSFMLGCAMLIWGFWREIGRCEGESARATYLKVRCQRNASKYIL
jgi:hypothetical protein